MAKGVKFGERAARRIVAATLDHERGGRDQPPIRFRQVAEDGGQEPRLGRISSTWNKGTVKEVTLLDADGTVASPTLLFDATNYFATVDVTSGTRKVLCVFVGDRWLLVAAECTTPTPCP